MTSRRLSLIVAAGGCALLLAACGGGGEASTSDAASAPSAANEDATENEAAIDDLATDSAGEDAGTPADGSTAEVDAAITAMISGMSQLASLTGSDAEADIATAAAAYEDFVTGVGELEKATNVPAEVLTPAVDAGMAVVDATANFQLSLEALVEGTGDAEAVGAAMDALATASENLNFVSDDLTDYTSLSQAELEALYGAAS